MPSPSPANKTRPQRNKQKPYVGSHSHSPVSFLFQLCATAGQSKRLGFSLSFFLFLTLHLLSIPSAGLLISTFKIHLAFKHLFPAPLPPCCSTSRSCLIRFVTEATSSWASTTSVHSLPPNQRGPVKIEVILCYFYA